MVFILSLLFTTSSFHHFRRTGLCPKTDLQNPMLNRFKGNFFSGMPILFLDSDKKCAAEILHHKV